MRIRTFGGLWIEGPTGSPALGPRRLALLALVASAGRKGVSRDRVIGILWPDAEEEQARHTLSQTIYTLKKDTGRDWIIPGPDLRLDPGVSSEIGDLKEALVSGGFEAVENLAGAVFLDGFYLAGAPEFERWVEEERNKLKSSISRALEQAATRADSAGDHAVAVRVWTQLTELEPLSARYATGRMRALAGAGDRASALAFARSYEELVRRELETDVDPSVRQLAATLRAEARPPDAASTSGSPPAAPIAATAPGPPAPVGGKGRRRAVGLALLAPLLLAGWYVLFRPDTPDRVPILAVGDIDGGPSPDSLRLGTVLRDMLATSLGGIEGLQVVANSRLVELLPRGENAPGSTNDAARRAGATEMIEGELAVENGGFILSLRRVTLGTGVLRKGYVIRARDRYEVVDSAAAAIARDFGRSGPSSSVARARTSSPTAYALYDEGLRAYYAFDAPAAFRLMNAAIAQDSTFAMPAFQAWRISRGMALPDSVQVPLLELTKRLMSRIGEPERLLIQAHVANVDAPLPVAVALADTLAMKYPNDPDAQLLVGDVRGSQGDWTAAVLAFERAFLLDSLAGNLNGPYCRICHAIDGVIRTSLWADSAEAAVRAARRLIAIQPEHAHHWRAQIEALLRLGRTREAEEAMQRGGGARGMVDGFFLRDLLRWGRYEEADRILSENAVSHDALTRSEGRWLLVLSLRDQGRFREADTLFRLQRLPNSRQPLPYPVSASVDLALVGVDRGRPELSIRVHRGNAAGHARSRNQPALRSRSIVWNLALAATAYATMGDTVTVLRLADSVEAIGATSQWARDTRLHHMVRGLVHQIGGRHEQAVDAFRKSLYSVTDGYTRTNLLMARSLLALRRPDEAIAILRPAIRGGVDGSNTYVSRTELREALAQAFEMAGQLDSARTHYAVVERSWRRADPLLKSRYETARNKARTGT